MHRFLVAWIGVGMGLAVCHVSRAAEPAEAEAVYEGKPLSHWIGALGGADPNTRAAAIDALRRVGKPAVPALIGALQDKNERVRRNAAVAFRNIGPDATAAVPALTKVLQDEKTFVGLSAAAALLTIDPGSPAAFRALAKWIRDDDEKVRHGVVELLYDFPVPAAVPVLIQALKDPNANIREWASLDLSQIGRAALPAVPALIEANFDDEEHIRGYVEEAIRQIGESAVPALSAGPRISGRSRSKCNTTRPALGSRAKSNSSKTARAHGPECMLDSRANFASSR
jgi:HEAT repeat protein